ncbi:MAG: DUF1109 domain-containing protein [Rubrivivax sp.]|nr:DUF1109 domain-containing protein [Rubrivivax sp.]
MKTDELIDLLARNAGPAPSALAARRLAPAAGLGLLLASVGSLAVIGLIPMPMFSGPVPWMKLAYGGALALAAGWLTARLSRPAAPTTAAGLLLLAVVAAMLLLALSLWLQQPALTRWAELLGHSWSRCPFIVLMLSLPALAGTLWAVRGLAPTRPRAAGFAAGLLAGSVGACGYALSCTEASPMFVALWYTLGIALTGFLGAALGPRVLRW